MNDGDSSRTFFGYIKVQLNRPQQRIQYSDSRWKKIDIPLNRNRWITDKKRVSAEVCWRRGGRSRGGERRRKEEGVLVSMGGRSKEGDERLGVEVFGVGGLAFWG